MTNKILCSCMLLLADDERPCSPSTSCQTYLLLYYITHCLTLMFIAQGNLQPYIKICTAFMWHMTTELDTKVSAEIAVTNGYKNKTEQKTNNKNEHRKWPHQYCNHILSLNYWTHTGLMWICSRIHSLSVNPSEIKPNRTALQTSKANQLLKYVYTCFVNGISVTCTTTLMWQ